MIKYTIINKIIMVNYIKVSPSFILYTFITIYYFFNQKYFLACLLSIYTSKNIKSNLKNNNFLIIDNEQQNQNFDYEYYED